MDQKLKQASHDITGFYDGRFPAEYSEISAEFGKVAADTGVHLSGIKYEEKAAPIEDLRRLNIEIALSGDYLQEVKFINGLERDKMFFLIDGVALGEQQGNVRLQLKLETYLARGSSQVVKLGTENKTKTILPAVGLGGDRRRARCPCVPAEVRRLRRRPGLPVLRHGSAEDEAQAALTHVAGALARPQLALRSAEVE